MCSTGWPLAGILEEPFLPDTEAPSNFAMADDGTTYLRYIASVGVVALRPSWRCVDGVTSHRDKAGMMTTLTLREMILDVARVGPLLENLLSSGGWLMCGFASCSGVPSIPCPHSS